jgi:hypothetical protein
VRLGPGAHVVVRLGPTNRRADMSQIPEMRRFGRLESLKNSPSQILARTRPTSTLFPGCLHQPRKLAPFAFRNLRVTNSLRDVVGQRTLDLNRLTY